MSGTPDDRSAWHSISANGLDGLLQGSGDGALVDELIGAEHSRRLLLLRALYDRSVGLSSGSDDSPLSLSDAWELLERVQAKAPEVVEDVLMAPGTGTWLSCSLRILRKTLDSEIPLWATLGHLASLASASAAAARIEFTSTVPVNQGTVSLPGLGYAVLPTDEDWTTARVTGDQRRLRITGSGGEVVVGPDRARRAPGWQPTRRVTLGRGTAARSVTLEEHDPYRGFSGASAPRALSESEARAWRSSLAEAWDILQRDEPTFVDALRRGLMSITPLPRGERFRPYSSSSAEAFGGLNISLSDEGAELAATLVHEFQHVKLGALTHLAPLVRQPETEEQPDLFRAPWRDDPRPLEGMLHGIYAFLGVTRFWRVHRRAAEGARAPLAHFEFALWRDAVWSALDAVRRHERLTPLGRRLLDSLAQSCAGWLSDDVPAVELRLAREAAASHRARWREHHLRPSPEVVDEAVRAWRRRDDCPPSLHTAPVAVAPDGEAHFLDTAAVLARHRLAAPDGSWRDPAGAGEGVRGADRVDILLAREDRADARRELADRLLYGDPPVGSWAALGRALADSPEQQPACRFLLRSPEWARAVRGTLRAEYGERPDPVVLATWLAGAGRPPGTPG
ncbi:HEXXH motif domain-containing protein [Streptomyces viridochromogenes]|uniref:HEXXH motif domain-containing protein n=1 Tax=Streptomyces viridochromogenes TaxID=1938 RepID=UPI00065C84C6|nr:HEXXH motif domain-containing protein [Streptomyces viridochromogenes]